ncbi:MAG: serine hydrolase domain-containing protein [Gemmatimonadota bacterium]
MVSLVAACAPPPITPHAQPQKAAWEGVNHYLDSVVADGAAPGAVVGVSIAGRHFFHGTGRLGNDDATRPDSATIYDLASLTKVIGLTTAVMFAVDEGRLTLDSSVTRYVPAFEHGDSARSAVTIRHLLTHSSGLPAWRPIYRETNDRLDALAAVDTTPLDTLPGTRFLYSDLGAIVLTQAVEGAYGTRLDTLLANRVFGPLALHDTRYLPPAEWMARIAPTENDPWRGRVLRGEVHDENAAGLGGVSGHAGLFSSARDLVRFGEWLLGGTGSGCSAPPASLSPPHSAAAFIQRQELPPGSSRALGWDTPSGESSAGHHFSARSFGHTGFTGTSIWIDPTRCLVLVLLSNRVHPSRSNNRWGPVRAGVADRVVAMFGDSVVTP